MKGVALFKTGEGYTAVPYSFDDDATILIQNLWYVRHVKSYEIPSSIMVMFADETEEGKE